MPINHLPEKESDNIPGKEKKNKIISFRISQPQYSLDDVILSDSVREELDNALSLIKYNDLIFNKWGLNTVIKHHNLCINLYGPSGTGKTMTAHGIAKELNKDLVIVNYAELESKYVGETSKNLVALFEYARANDVVVLFDEADAMLSKRVTSMQNATDVSANQTRNTLLKLLDEYEGVVTFTTNFIQNFDSAFFRRIFTHIKFELPDENARRKIWEHYLIQQLPVTERGALIDRISKVENLTGADISTIVLKAAIMAANKGKSISYSDVSDYASKIAQSKSDMNGGYEITTRKVTEEYALKQIRKGEKNGNT
ncbi:MAG: ATP-binding protein [Lachnospiraceae bacterium]|nr:ATP-binding protein [Lachnospiraceae bacterium]